MAWPCGQDGDGLSVSTAAAAAAAAAKQQHSVALGQQFPVLVKSGDRTVHIDTCIHMYIHKIHAYISIYTSQWVFFLKDISDFNFHNNSLFYPIACLSYQGAYAGGKRRPC